MLNRRVTKCGPEKKLLTIIRVKELRFGIIILLILLCLAIFAPIIAPYNPNYEGSDLAVAPGGAHLLGTDGLGRDVFSMILFGLRISLTIGVTAALISGVIGTLLGGLAGYFRGVLDRVLTEVNNIFLIMPVFFLVLVIVSLFGSSVFTVIVVISMTTWVGNARLMRAQAMSFGERTFVQSALAIGETRIQILLRHIIPNGIYPIISNTTMNISAAILLESSLSFIGLGNSNVMSLGQIIYEGQSYLSDAWWISTFPGLAIVFTVIAFFLIGDGLNRVLSPRLRDSYLEV